MEKLHYEEVLPVDEYGWTQDPAVVEQVVAKTLEAAGVQGVKFDGAEFLEFDSTNPTHACGYWDVFLVGPADQLVDLSAWLEDEQ